MISCLLLEFRFEIISYLLIEFNYFFGLYAEQKLFQLETSASSSRLVSGRWTGCEGGRRTRFESLFARIPHRGDEVGDG
jgi:hypothetical protein